MERITYISAGAGSGKTYKLTHILADLISKHKVKPEEVILTTFTRKAAAEIMERAKEVLYEQGMIEEASKLDLARIGTVHSVAYNFISKYWYYLGISPNLRELQDEDVELYKEQSIAEMASREDIQFFYEFRDFFNVSTQNGPYMEPDRDFWKRHLKDIVDKSTQFDVKDFTNSRSYSLDFVNKLCPGVFHLPSEGICKQTLAELLTANEADTQSQATLGRIDSIKDLQGRLKRLTISDYQTLAGLCSGPAKIIKQCTTARDLAISLGNLFKTNEVQERLNAYINKVFDMADKWKYEYSEYKKKNRLIDFNDMEQFFLELLDKQEVKEDIKASYKYLFVDEFQDSSPVQVKIFDKLSDLMEGGSFWVGDAKQAIYGFRGSDTELTSAVAGQIENLKNKKCASQTLDTSYRSSKAIVDLTNKIFVPAFSNTLKEDKVALKQHKTDKGALKLWKVPSEAYNEIVADGVCELVKSGVEPKDIAILARNNNELPPFIDLLSQYDIPVNIEENSADAPREKVLLFSLLSLMVDKEDSLARAQIDYITRKGANIGSIIDKKLETNKSDFLSDNPLIKHFLEKRDSFKNQPIRAMIESIIVEMDLYNESRKWSASSNSINIFESLIALAGEYEQHCQTMLIPATVTGFMSYAADSNNLGNSSVDGVTLSTYHGAKGLEWKYVILLSLSNDPQSKVDRYEYFGVSAFHPDGHGPSVDDLYPEMIISLRPWIFGTKKKIDDSLMPIIEADPRHKKAHDDALEEGKRLLYVGVTRAKDTLILAEKESNKSKSSFLRWFKSMGTTVQDGPDYFGCGMKFTDEIPEIEEAYYYGGAPQEGKTIDYRVNTTDNSNAHYPLRDISPSSIMGEDNKPISGEIKVLEHLGRTIHLGGIKDMADAGTCIHNVFCGLEACKPEDRQTFAQRVIDAEGYANKIPAEDVVAAWDKLTEYLNKTFKEPTTTYHELPFKYAKNGQFVTGSMDYIYDTPEGMVLIDFKTFPGTEDQLSNPESEHYAGKYKGQFDCYTTAITLSGRKVRQRLVFYPVNGLIIEML